MEWKYVKPLKDNSIIEHLEKTYSIEIPKFLKEIILENNGERPVKKYVYEKRKQRKSHKTLVSYN